MRTIYGQFNITQAKGLSPHLWHQHFTTTWAGITPIQEVLKLRYDNEKYFKGMIPNGDEVIEALFTEEEALHFQKKYPDTFHVLVY